jgi:hypothetical protein
MSAFDIQLLYPEAYDEIFAIAQYAVREDIENARKREEKLRKKAMRKS